MEKTQIMLHEQAENAGLDPITFMLMGAAANGFTTEAEDLIKRGADVNGSNIRTGKRAIDLASEKGNTKIVRLLINNGADIQRTQSHHSPLELAAARGHTETAALLIEHGANINQTIPFQMSALQLALMNRKKNTVKLLIENGANVNHNPCEQFRSPLMIAMRGGNANLVEALIEGGANIDCHGCQDLSVLETALMNRNPDMAKLLIEKGAKTDGALMQAFKINCTEVVDILLNKEIDVNHKDKYGMTLLMIAATWGQTELMTNLIDKGSDIEEKDNEGMTALMYASSNGCFKAVEMLIENKANVNEKSNDQMSPLMYACGSNLQCKDAVEKLIGHGAYVNERCKDGKTALMYASICGFTGIVEKLIEHGAYLNERCKEGWTALMYASQIGCSGTAKLLIEKRADLNIMAIIGDTALILATRYEKTDIVKALLDKGADVHIQGKDGLSARQIAMLRFSGQTILNMFVEQISIISKNIEKDYEALNKPMRFEKMPTGHDTNISQDKNSTKQSGHSDEVLNSLSHDIQQLTKLDGSKLKDLSGKTRDNLDTTGSVTQEKAVILLCETHDKTSMQSKKRKRKKQKRYPSLHKELRGSKCGSRKRKVTKQCHLSDLEVSIPKDPRIYGSNVKRHQVSTSYGSNVKSPQGPRSDGNVKSHKVPRSYGSNVKSHRVPTGLGLNVKSHIVSRSHGSNVKRHNGRRRKVSKIKSSKNASLQGPIARSDIFGENFDQQTLYSQNLLVHSFGTSKSSSDTVSTDNTVSVGKVSTDKFQSGHKKVADVLEEFKDNFIPKLVKIFSGICPATSYKKESTPLNATSHDMDKIILQLEKFLRNIYHPPQRRSVFKLVLINNVRQAHLKNPSCVNIRKVEICNMH